jgi:hypothetical protein
MFKSAWCALLSAVLSPSAILGQQASSADYAVGFHLTIDYGLVQHSVYAGVQLYNIHANYSTRSVASVYFSNGSFADIAQIKGGSNYQQAMREAYAPDNSPAVLHDSASTSWHRSLDDWLPPWLGGKKPRPNHLIPMVRALKAATESYIEATVPIAQVITSFPVSDTVWDDMVSACSAVSLRMHRDFQLAPAGLHAIYGYSSVDESLLGGDEQLILAVEYSRAALTALIVDEEWNVFDRRWLLHDPTLGAEHLRDPEQLEEALREFIQSVLKNSVGGQYPGYLNNLVFLGDSTGDVRLHAALKKVLGELYSRLIASVSHSRDMINPLYAAAWGAAHFGFERVDAHDEI